jgi:hypothetical protein
MTATASITAGQATGGSAELLLGSAVIATDASISSGDTSVSFTLGLTTTTQVQAAIAAGGVLTTRLIDLAGNTSASSTSVNLAVDYVVQDWANRHGLSRAQRVVEQFCGR